MAKVPAQFAKNAKKKHKHHADNKKVAEGYAKGGKDKDDDKKLPPWMRKKKGGKY